jgi:peptide/nickel transport system permease protein
LTTYLLRRLVYSIFVILGGMTLIFIVVRIIPGDVAQNYLPIGATNAEIAALRNELGLNDPYLVQYGRFIMNAIRFDFGESLYWRVNTMRLIGEHLPKTIQLAASALLISIIVSFPLGVAAARRLGKLVDRTITSVSLVGQSLAPFWVGLVLILIFSRKWALLPSAGSRTLSHFILPSVTLALPFVSLLVRLIRGGLLEVINMPYIDSARAKGMTERRVIYVHAVRNMLIPVVTVIGLQLGSLIAGAVVVEMVFAWPGVGRLLVQGIYNRDYVVVQAVVVILTISYVFINLAVDILYTYLDPRVRLGAR